MGMTKYIWLGLFLFWNGFAFSETLSGGKSEAHFLPDQIRLTVWNIYKGQDDQARQELEELKKSSDLLLLQEVLLSDLVQESWSLDSLFEWVFASAWKRSQGPTGTAILGKARPLFQQSLISSDTEPFANTPKSSALAEYAVEGSSENLLVISTHALNFTFMGPFQRQLESIAEKIKTHQGPVIWAGDFNTWNWARWDFLYEKTESLGLSALPVLKQERFLVLDHIFVRGFQPSVVELMTQWQTSDHWPLNADLKFD